MGHLTDAPQAQPKQSKPGREEGNGANGQVFWSGLSGMVRVVDHERAWQTNEIVRNGQVGQVFVTTYMLESHGTYISREEGGHGGLKEARCLLD
jgi:hypothetical protein